MKAFPVLGELYLLFSLIWTCSGEQPVYVRCSPSLFLARVKSTAFDNDLPVGPEEVFLGDHCPVTSVHQGFYEFRYHPTDCKIRIQTLPRNHLLFITEIIFLSLISILEASIPVACAVPRHPAPIRISIGNDANKQGGPPKRSGIANLYIGKPIDQEVESYNYFCHLKHPLNSSFSTWEFRSRYCPHSCDKEDGVLEAGVLSRGPVCHLKLFNVLDDLIFNGMNFVVL